jgi:hypothetical protein
MYMIYTLYQIYSNGQVSDVIYMRVTLIYLLLFKYFWKVTLVLMVIDLLYIWWNSRNAVEDRDQLDFDLITIGPELEDTPPEPEVEKTPPEAEPEAEKTPPEVEKTPPEAEKTPPEVEKPKELT